MEKWYNKKGFRKNPLSTEPEFKRPLHGYDVLLEEIFYRINSGNMIFIEGDTAKTSILFKVIERYKGKGKVAYVDCNKITEDLSIKELIANGRKCLKTKISRLKKRMIILLDNIENLSSKNAEMMKYYFDQNDIQSVVMASKSYEKTNIPASIKHRIGNRVYQTREPTVDEAVEIVLERLNYCDYITQNQVEKIAVKNHKYGIKGILEEIDVALFLTHNAHEKVVTDGIINRLLIMPKEERDSYNI
jgi:Cdc6-like AAA superfamily ATPase